MARSTCWIASLVVQASLFGLLLGLLFTPTLDTTGNKFNVNAADGEAHAVIHTTGHISCADDGEPDKVDQRISASSAVGCFVTKDKSVSYGGIEDVLSDSGGGEVCNANLRCPSTKELLRAHRTGGGPICKKAGVCDIPVDDLTSFNSKYNTYVVQNWTASYFGYTPDPDFGKSVAYANRLGPHVGFEELTTEIGDQLYTEGVLLWISVALTFVTFVLLACADADDDTWIPGNSSKYVRAAGALTNLVLLATFSTILAKMVDSSPNEGDGFARTVDMNTVPDHFLGNFHIPELRDEIPEFVYFENSRTPALEAMILTIAGAVLLAVNVGIWARRDGEHGYTVLGFLHL